MGSTPLRLSGWWGGGGGGLRQGTSLWGKRRCSVWCRNFSHKIFCVIWGTSCSLYILSGGSSQVLLRCCWQSVCLPKFHTAICPQGTKGWGCRSFPCLMALHQNWRCAEIFSPQHCPQTKIPPHARTHARLAHLYTYTGPIAFTAYYSMTGCKLISRSM